MIDEVRCHLTGLIYFLDLSAIRKMAPNVVGTPRVALTQ